MNPGLACDGGYSNADGGGGGWIGSLIDAIGGLGEAGIGLGATSIATKEATKQAQLASQAATAQAAYAAGGNQSATQMLAAALGAKYANQPQPQQGGISTNVLLIGGLLLAVGITVFFVLKD